MSNSKFDAGMAVRRSVLGDAHVDRAEANKTDFDREFQQFITETAWGTVWTRGEIDKQTRHLLTICILATLGKEHELAMHIRATQNTGVSPRQLVELFHQVAIYDDGTKAGDIDVNGDRTGYAGCPGGPAGGRYIDRFERRDGQWAIAARKTLLDWEGTPDDKVFTSRERVEDEASEDEASRDRSDPSYLRPLDITSTTPAYRSNL